MKIYSQNGMPVVPAHKESYKKELNEVMDKIESQVGKCTAENAAEFATKVEVLHRELTAKYPIYQQVSYPGSMKEMMKLIEQYNGSVAFCNEDGRLVAYVMN